MARRILIVAGLLALGAAPAAAQLKAKRKELSRIQVELKQTLRELDGLRAAERELGEDVRGMESRDAKSRHRVDGLQSDIRRAESKRADLKSRLDAARSVTGFWSAAIASEAARYAALSAASRDMYGTRDLWADEFRRDALIEKGRHLRGLRGFRLKTEEAAAETRRRAQELAESRRRAETELSGGRREYEAKKAALEQTQVKVAAAARRAKELEESAHALTSLLDKIGKAGRYRKTGPAVRLEFPKHSLPWPAEGKVLRSFGRERDPELGTWTVRQGTLFSSEIGAAVGSVARGRVIFSGPFRSYGQVVIVDHDGGFFSVYGELGEIKKNKGDLVRAGETLARSDGRIYLELRRGTEALDPEEWLKR